MATANFRTLALRGKWLPFVLQMLMTREYRARLAAGSAAKPKPTHGVIRVRLPDGLMLQGDFSAGEQASGCGLPPWSP